MREMTGTKGMKVFLPKEKPFNWATFITTVRLGLSIPLVFYFLPNEYLLISLFLIITCGVLDVIDGIIARWLKVESEFGAAMDTLADKLMICGVFTVLWYLFPQSEVHVVAFTAVLLREIGIMVIRTCKPLPSDEAGKIKMVLQCSGLAILIYHLKYGILPLEVPPGYIVWFISLFTFGTGIWYLLRAFILKTKPSA